MVLYNCCVHVNLQVRMGGGGGGGGNPRISVNLSRDLLSLDWQIWV